MSDTTISRNIFIKKFVLALCRAFELLNRRMNRHLQRVTIISLKLAQKLDLNPAERTTLFYAALLHDIGSFSSNDKTEIMKFDYSDCLAHCEFAYKTLSRIELLNETAEPIRYHHDNWLGPNKSGLAKNDIPFLSQIIHIADRAEVLINDEENIVPQAERITGKIAQYSEKWFNPALVDCLQLVGKDKVFWLTLTSDFMDDILQEFSPEDERRLTIDHMIQMASIFAQIVDYKSRHTNDHSVKVTETALKIGKTLNWSQINLKRLWVAALLHDIGKLSIPDEILEKTAGLTPNEYAIIKRHPYYTYQILSAIPDFEEIAQWALFHHEFLNGKGYPFGVDGENIPEGARIIAVADKYIALTEDRPYRKKSTPEEAIKILEGDVKRAVIDEKILNILKMIVLKKFK